ncbi:MAG: hypothetical protein GXP42_15220 [Chloroflexi bacterium]|nr:hypothetical protein [Chloroflexota bacterium]
MHTTPLTIPELMRNFSRYVSRVLHQEERFILIEGRKPVAELRPVSSGRLLGELSSLVNALPKLDPTDADSFAEDVTRIRYELEREELRDPWES